MCNNPGARARCKAQNLTTLAIREHVANVWFIVRSAMCIIQLHINKNARRMRFIMWILAARTGILGLFVKHTHPHTEIEVFCYFHNSASILCGWNIFSRPDDGRAQYVEFVDNTQCEKCMNALRCSLFQLVCNTSANDDIAWNAVIFSAGFAFVARNTRAVNRRRCNPRR